MWRFFILVSFLHAATATAFAKALGLALKDPQVRSSLGDIVETWLTSNNKNNYDIPDYNSIHSVRTERRGGGVSLFISSKFEFKPRPDLDTFNDDIESLFIEIPTTLIDGAVIDTVKTTTFLGVKIDNKLTFDEHLIQTCNKSYLDHVI
ncbi:hypothetical protein CAPTEDRAFT_187399 [Capitella teleta]|uniref:Uncharacterized protein n=1 Tax=Capitella teleta TaxID=283909 RepID=R7TZ18_CAPTE|nr:hypothetical protein CAPTEDRAFT_187399 [Capitella teleta]|eukprot:ELT96661.1 hypothetical protein CAPTEDRAFT_187399 [Capitella teleta]